MERINIAIDGPAGAGKSTIAKHISKTLGIIYLDTGAMYRAVALKAIKEGIDTKDSDKLADLIKDINIKVNYSKNEQQIFLDNIDVSQEIRTPQVSIGASNVAAIPDVRLKLVELQREIAANNDVVMDGRDIGTFVLPDSRFKFFLTASINERARRRYNELLERSSSDVTFEQVKKEMEYRDNNDSSRKFAPLSKAEDAVEIDTTNLTILEVAEKIITIIENKKSNKRN